ncbi:GNAT family acetyltransferase (plasmid) [Legionella adelaidensis]|uniref:GNAT family acetyltransferase n=1 Tax=Legionella adelaidensis TaxID=45056 RepID=A0A0W0R1S1_9GAMM|nr:GNAT family N-acetyltransferase [Legionella adelaidensis]KTC64997.1 GNAT family acetyltransferase [Legionella adelaidensis]VEH85323.1 GNAT family acetyltransferase [Legionella adelaidensis]
MDKYLIKTKRLGLRFITKGDIKHLEALDTDPEVKEFFPSGTLSPEEMKQMVFHCITNCKTQSLPCFVIFDLKTEEFAGRAYFDNFESDIKVGYLFHKKFWNRGYATEVLLALLDWAKTHIPTDHIIAYADKNNKASLQVMKKCGMHYYKDGVFKGMLSKFYRFNFDNKS